MQSIIGLISALWFHIQYPPVVIAYITAVGNFDVAVAMVYKYIYGSTLYVGMTRKTNGCPYISIASDDLKSLVIYRF